MNSYQDIIANKPKDATHYKHHDDGGITYWLIEAYSYMYWIKNSQVWSGCVLTLPNDLIPLYLIEEIVTLRNTITQLQYDLMGDKPKFNPRKMACFQEVADVIGDVEAENQLNIAIIGYDMSKECKKTHWYYLNGDIVEAFDWKATPQGYGFWHKISIGDV